MNTQAADLPSAPDAMHIHRGRMQAVLYYGRANQRITAHFGDAVIEGFRFASAFFGKGEFSPSSITPRGDGLYFRQELSGQYYQPLRGDQLEPVTRDNWSKLKMRREVSEECRLTYRAHIRAIDNGLEMRIHATGTDNVPIAVEIALRPGGQLEGVVPAPDAKQAFLLRDGHARYRVGDDVVQIGPGKAQHGYTQIRGAAKRLTDTGLYFTGLTPFDHAFTLEME
ncbi:MAG TPA: hypothetical protein ENN29_01105 [Candidatus Hydrogenedentes bacterium]|nr:hypothetical protein [Candidatus Hydrogenedentota bacterium]